jgi:hypothetical protein
MCIGRESNPGLADISDVFLGGGLLLATANFTTKPPMLCMKRRDQSMGLVRWRERSGGRRGCKHEMLYEEWRMCRGGDDLAAVLLRRIW